MDEGYNVIQYVIPESSKMIFDILSHARNVIVKLLTGVSDLCVNDREISLPLGQEFPVPIWECLCPRLKAKTASDFLVQGSHYASLSTQKGEVENTLCRVFESGDSFSFVLDRNVLLQIYPIKCSKKDACITIKSTRGSPEICGLKLSPRVSYSLIPFSPTLIMSSNNEPYSVYVQGLNRKVKLSILDENRQMCVKGVREFVQCLSLKKPKPTNSIILVMGPKGTGKTSFCQLLVNDALENNFSPLYIDLNIQRNLALPGSLSLTEIRCRIGSNLDFEYDSQQMLHFGTAVFHPVNLRYYYFLIRKMSWLLTFHRRFSNKKFITIIDTDGSQGESGPVIERILKSFSVDLAVVIADHSYYEKMKNTLLRTVQSEFIPKLQVFEPKNDYYDSNYYQYRINKYFYGRTSNSTPNACVVRFNCFSVYRVSISGNSRQADDEKLSDCSMERIECNPNMVHKLFAVSTAKSAEFLSMPEVKYYVCITKMNIPARTATFLAPKCENFTGGILLLGDVLMLKNWTLY